MNARSIGMLVVLASSVASAQPLKPTDKVPTTTVPCAMSGDLELHAIGEEPVLCWETGCMRLDLDKATASPVEKPPAAVAWPEPVADVKADRVCVGEACKTLGKKLVAAIAHAREEAVPRDPPRILATSNLKTVVVGATAWNVDRDRPIKLAEPVGLPSPLGKNRSKTPAVRYIDIAGDLLLVHWSNCVDDDFCTRVQLTDAAGRAIGPHHDGGGLAPIELAPEISFVIVSENASVQFFDMRSGKYGGAIELLGRPAAAVRIDKQTVALLYSTFADSNTVHVATLGWGVEPYVSRSMTLPLCSRRAH